MENSGGLYFYRTAFDITPHDTNLLAKNTKAIYCGAGGDLKVDTVNGDTVTFKAVPIGTVLHIAVKKVYATGTAGTPLLIGLA